MECIKIDIQNIRYLINKKNDTKIMSINEEIEYYDNLLILIEKTFTENYNTLNLDNGHDEYIKTEKMTVIFTTTANQKKNINNNLTTIDLGDCETLLKNDYNISINETLYMKILDIPQENMKTSKVEYNLYFKLFGVNLIKLNLTACEKSKILIYIPFKITENIDKYNISSGYYNDICYTTTSEDGEDITIKDRRKKYMDGDKIVCQEDCEFSKYDSEYFKAIYSCHVKRTSPSIINMKIDKLKLFKNFKNIKNFANFNFLVCYKKLLNKKGIINNIGSYLLIIILFFHIIDIIIFYINQFSSLTAKIKDIMKGINEEQLIEEKKKTKKKNQKVVKKTKKKKIFNEHSDIIKMIKIRKKGPKKKKKSSKRNLDIIGINKVINNNFKKNNQIENFTTNIVSKSDNKRNKKNLNNNSIKEDKKEKIKDTMKYIDDEINLLNYNFALQYDKRSFCTYYISLLKTKHNLIMFLSNNNDYNSQIIKFDLFLIGFTIDYIVNALFYNDDTIHKIYESKGQFELEAQIPIIVYSSLISIILSMPLKLLGLSNDAIIAFKQNKSRINLKKREEDLRNKLLIKFIFYFIFSFLLLIFFWYYISMFCIIYKNTQIHLLKDTLMSFCLSLIYSFGIYLLPGIFRMHSLSNRQYKKEYLYKFSKILQSL